MTTKKKNPFFLTDYDTPENFCGRQKELGALSGALSNGRNVVLVSPRRMGKTGLVKHFFAQPGVRDNFHVVFVDIFATTCLSELVWMLSRAIYDAIKPKGQKAIDKFIMALTTLRAGIKFDPLNGFPSFEVGLGQIQKPELSLAEIFEYINKSDHPCIIAIDEFQQIGNYPEKNTEALLRTHIQSCNNASFVFSGSQQHMMQNMFFSSARPFYNSADYMLLEPLPIDEYVDFVITKMAENEREISRETVERVYRLFQGHSYYMHNVFNRLYEDSMPGDKLEYVDVDKAIDGILENGKTLYQNMIALLPIRQKEVLIAIAKEGVAREILSADFINRHSLRAAATVQSALQRLMDRALVSRIENVYVINDRFFSLWLRRHYC